MRVGIPAVLRDPAVRAVWTTELGDAVDRAVRGVAVPWLVLELTGDPVTLGVTFALYAAPDVLLAPVVGHAIDVLPPRGTLAVGEVLQGLLVATVGVAAATEALTVTALYAAMVALSVVVGLTHNARRTLLPTLADEDALDDANAALDAVRAALGLAALLAGGWLVATVGVGSALVLAGAAPALASLALVGVTVPPRERAAAGTGGLRGHLAGVRASARAGVAAVREHRVIRDLLVFGLAVNLLVTPLRSVLVPTLGRRGLAAGGALALTVLLAGYQVGSLVGTAVVPRLDRSRKALIVAGTAVVALGTAGTGVLARAGGVGGLAGATLALFVTGVGMPLFNVPSSSALQTAAPEGRRGTVVTAVNATLGAVFPLPLVGAGWLLATVEATTLLVGAGAGLLVVAVVAAGPLRFEPGPGRAETAD